MKLFFISIIASIIVAAINIRPIENSNPVHKIINDTTMVNDTFKKPTVVLETVFVNPMTVLFISDTAADMNSISKIFANDYGELFTFINQSGLKPMKVMAFYLSYENPLTLEAAVEIDKLTATLTGRIKSKIVEGGNAVVGHYTGPYEEMEMPYKTIIQWVKDNNKQAKGLPFEVYLNSPDTVKDKYDLKTDIYQLLQ